MNNIWLYIIIALIICIISCIITASITKSNCKYNREFLQNKINSLEQDIEDMNSGREKIPVIFGWHTYFVYKDATMEEVVKTIGSPTFVNYNFFGEGEHKMSWYYKCGFGDTPNNDKLAIWFKNNRIKSISNN